MQLDLSIPGHLSLALAPDLFLFAGAILLMLWAAWRPESDRHQRSVGMGSLVLTVGVLIAVIFVATRQWVAGNGVIAVDTFRWATDIVLLVGTLMAIGLSIDYNTREGITFGETHVLLLFSTGGMMLMAAARDLMVLFLGLELMSIAVYVLAGLNRRSGRSAEGSLKYFLLGAFSTGFLLYGIALVYGATGTTNLAAIGARIAELDLGNTPMLLVGIALLLVGFAFKLAAAPFHMWAPDVYEGAPTPTTGYMAVAVKAAAFAALLRVWLEAFPGVYTEWHKAIWWLAAVTMIVGNVVALQQRNLKRMLAYSSIAHTGFILVALAAGTHDATTAFVFYLAAYTLSTMGAFAVIIALGSPGQARETMDDFHGLWYERPGLAVAMTVFMLALLGFPIFGGMGFLAKWYVLQAALQAPAPQTRLAVLLVLTSAISIGYYLHVVMVMFMKPRPSGAGALPPLGSIARAVIVVSAVVILIVGIYPGPLVNLVRDHVALGAPAPGGRALPPDQAALAR
jgi:NADH-quinone oxidoreductase subunit N